MADPQAHLDHLDQLMARLGRALADKDWEAMASLNEKVKPAVEPLMAALEAGEVTKRSLKAVVFTTLAVTLLNPQVYLDTLLLIPAVGAQQEDATTFVAGASSASILWFGLLAWGGSALAPILARPLAWRIIDGVIGVMMAAIALHLTFSGL